MAMRLVCVLAARGYVEIRGLGGTGYALRLSPDTGHATEMFLTPSQLRLLGRHVDELLKDAA